MSDAPHETWAIQRPTGSIDDTWYDSRDQAEDEAWSFCEDDKKDGIENPYKPILIGVSPARLAAAEAERDEARAKLATAKAVFITMSLRLAEWKAWADEVEPYLPNDSSVPHELPPRPDAPPVCPECHGKVWDRVDVHEIPCPVCGGKGRA